MKNFLTGIRDDAGPLSDAAAANHFCRVLPQNDPFRAQQEVSGALADLTTGGNPDRDQFRALLALDRQTGKLIDTLLQNYADEPPEARSLERRSWQSAFELSRSFARAYDFALGHIRDSAPSRGWLEYAPAVLLGLFHHRQIEFLLRPFVNTSPVLDCWTEVHGAYKYARAQRLRHRLRAAWRIHEECAMPTTIEREYIHILLLELMSGGQFSPYDAFWVSRLIPRWCAVLSLQSHDAQGIVDRGSDRFVVDPDLPQGLMRTSRPTAGARLYLDPSPMLALINDEIAALRDRVDTGRDLSSFGRDRQLKLLRKLSTIFAPKPVRITRRGERRPAASTVQAIVGLAQITRMLRHELRRKSKAAPTEVPGVEEITITVDGGYTQYSSVTAGRNDSPRFVALNGEFGVPHQVWHLKDRSESGCRFRAQIVDANRLLPGTLVAIREGEDAPWTLVVVRLLRTRIGDRVDIGVEYVGRNPRVVVLSIDEQYAEGSNEPASRKRAHFTGLYLPECAKHPTMPFKTIILAAYEFRVGRCLKVQWVSATYTIRLKEPIEEQGDFIWLPYAVVDRRAADQPAQKQPPDGMPTMGRASQIQSLAAGSAVRRLR